MLKVPDGIAAPIAGSGACLMNFESAGIRSCKAVGQYSACKRIQLPPPVIEYIDYAIDCFERSVS